MKKFKRFRVVAVWLKSCSLYVARPVLDLYNMLYKLCLYDTNKNSIKWSDDFCSNYMTISLSDG
jgi:hypothetical protein